MRGSSVCSGVMWLECRMTKGGEGRKGGRDRVVGCLRDREEVLGLILGVIRNHWSVLSR